MCVGCRQAEPARELPGDNMVQAAGGGGGDSDLESDSILARRAVPGSGEHVQPQGNRQHSRTTSNIIGPHCNAWDKKKKNAHLLLLIICLHNCWLCYFFLENSLILLLCGNYKVDT